MEPAYSKPPPVRGSHWSLHVAAIASLLLVAAAYTWPLLSQPTTGIAGDARDPVLHASVLWWNATTLPFSAAWWDPPFFYPATGVTAPTESLAGLGVLATPLAWLTGNPVLTYNVTLFLSWPLSAAAMYWLVWLLTRRVDAALVAGLCYGFAPYRLGWLSQVQVLSAFWLPLALVALYRFLAGRRRPWLALFGAAWALQILTSTDVMLVGSALIAAWIAYFCSAARGRGAILPILFTWIVATLPLLPMLVGTHAVRLRDGRLREQFDASAPAAALLIAIIIATAIAWVWMRRARKAGGPTSRDPLVFHAVLSVVASLAATRVTPLWWIPGALFLAAAAGLMFARLVARDRRRRHAALAMVAVGFLLVGWPWSFPMADAPARASILDKPDKPAIVLELPMDDARDAAAVFRAITNQRRTFNGIAAVDPPHYALLREGITARDPAIFASLATFGPVDVLIDQSRDTGGALARLLAAIPGAVRTRDNGRQIVMRLPAQPEPQAGTRLLIAALQTEAGEPNLANLMDGRPETMWTIPWQVPNASITIDLGVAHDVTRVEHEVGPDLGAYPRRLVIEVSKDGKTWEQAWQGSTRAAAMRGAMEDPGRNVMRFVFPPRAARYVRLRLLVNFPMPWGAVELRVFGAS